MLHKPSKIDFYQKDNDWTKTIEGRLKHHGIDAWPLAKMLYEKLHSLFKDSDAELHIRKTMARLVLTKLDGSKIRIYFRGLRRNGSKVVGIAVQLLIKRGQYLDLFNIIDKTDLNDFLNYLNRQYLQKDRFKNLSTFVKNEDCQ